MYYIIINVGVIEVSAVIKANHGHLANTTTNLDENPNFCENINIDENTNRNTLLSAGCVLYMTATVKANLGQLPGTGIGFTLEFSIYA